MRLIKEVQAEKKLLREQYLRAAAKLDEEIEAIRSATKQAKTDKVWDAIYAAADKDNAEFDRKAQAKAKAEADKAARDAAKAAREQARKNIDERIAELKAEMKNAHPDHGGNHERAVEINLEIERLRKQRKEARV